MDSTTKIVGIPTIHLFPVLDKMLIDLLRSLNASEWNYPTVARLWSVKDIAAHLLDGNLRNLSASRDAHLITPDHPISSYTELVDYINGINGTWVAVAKRLSPQLLIELLESSGKAYTDHLSKLDPFEPAIYPVAWAGQTSSPNWFHIAREYTEKFIHQQQIREAVGKQALFTKELFYPYLQTSMFAVPPSLQTIPKLVGTTARFTVSSNCGGTWNFIHTPKGWVPSDEQIQDPTAHVIVPASLVWKLFSKATKPDEVRSDITFKGDITLCNQLLRTIAVMA